MMTVQTLQHWHLLDARPIWVKELAGALSRLVTLHNWIPEISWSGFFQTREHSTVHDNPHLILRHFPLQRGFAKWPMRWIVNEGKRLADRLRCVTPQEAETVLMCVSPHYADVAETWNGPVIYYMSDLYYAWGDDPSLINYYDRRMCRRANLVCPVSERGRSYLIEQAACLADKISISPMATRASNLLPEPLLQPAVLPAPIADLPRPIITIIGNLARNTDWLFLQQAIDLLPGYSWVFVGSTEMAVPDSDHWQARKSLQKRGAHVRFLGPKPYHELASYARSCDIALLPYRKIEPTFSGSSTRFYEHLAACRPMFATHGFAELLTKEPLVHLVNDAAGLVEQVQALALKGFVDGVETMRWQASHAETWEARASDMHEQLLRRL